MSSAACLDLPSQRVIRDRWLARATCPSERLQTQLPLVCQPGCLVVSCLLRFSSQRATRDRWLARATCPSERPQTDMESCNRHGFTCVVWLCSIDQIRTYPRCQCMLHSNLGNRKRQPRCSEWTRKSVGSRQEVELQKEQRLSINLVWGPRAGIMDDYLMFSYYFG